MLHVSEGMLKIAGTKVDIMAEFTLLVNTLLEREMLTVDEINHCIEVAKKSPDEIKEETIALLLKLIEES